MPDPCKEPGCECGAALHPFEQDACTTCFLANLDTSWHTPQKESA